MSSGSSAGGGARRLDQAGGVELEELEVADGCPGPDGERQAICRSHGGIGGLGEQLSCSPGGQQYGVGAQDHRRPPCR